MTTTTALEVEIRSFDKLVCEVIAPAVGGITASDGSLIAADQMIDGGPSVLYDAVAVLPGKKGIDELLMETCARDFVADAFAHCKFIGHSAAADRLFVKAGIADALDEGMIALATKKDVSGFVKTLGDLRLWARAIYESTIAAPHLQRRNERAVISFFNRRLAPVSGASFLAH